MASTTKTPLVLSCPLETQAVVSTLAPLVYGAEGSWSMLETLFCGGRALGPAIGAAFCSYPATSALQALLARSIGGKDAAQRALLMREVMEWFGIDQGQLPVPTHEGDWTVNEVVLTPIDRVRASVTVDPVQLRRMRCLRKTVNSEIDVVLEGEASILFIEAKLTSPLEMDKELGVGQLLRQGLVAALVHRLTGKPVRLACLGVSEKDARRHQGSRLADGLRLQEATLWAEAEDLARTAAVVSWDEVKARTMTPSNPLAARWFTALGNEVRRFDRRRRAYVPVTS